MVTTKNLSSMEPMLPPDGVGRLEDLAIELAAKASGLASKLRPAVAGDR